MNKMDKVNYKMYEYYITIEPHEWNTFCNSIVDYTFTKALDAFNVILNDPKISIISGRFDEHNNQIIIVYDRS